MSNKLQKIERSCTKLSGERERLAAKVAVLQKQVDQVKKRHVAGIRRLMARVAAAHLATHELVTAAPELFEDPKSLVISGVKVGFKKSRDRLEIANEEKTIALIRRLYPENHASFVQVSETAIKAALAQLDDAALKRLKVERIDGSNESFCRPQDSELDSLLVALLGNVEP